MLKVILNEETVHSLVGSLPFVITLSYHTQNYTSQEDNYLFHGVRLLSLGPLDGL